MAPQRSPAKERHQGRRFPAGSRPRGGAAEALFRSDPQSEGRLMDAKSVYIVDGARTPFLKSKNRPGPFAASDLATQAGRTPPARHKFDPTQPAEVIPASPPPPVDEGNNRPPPAPRPGCGRKGPRR